MRPWILLLPTGLLLVGVLTFQQFRLHQIRAERIAEEAAFTATIKERETELALAAENLSAKEQVLADLKAEEQNRLDRIENLETQRDHLADNLKAANKAFAKAEVEREQALAEREEALHAKLKARTLPEKLRGDLRRAQARIGELENQLDQEAATAAEFPDLLTVADLSADGSVFLLEGESFPTHALPRPILLCRDNEVLLQGWLNRREGGIYVGHVDSANASALVKGEKVFILQRSL